VKPWPREIWRALALMSLACSLVVAAGVSYIAFAFKQNLTTIMEGAPVCLGNFRSYDSIAAAQSIGRLDAISFLLTVGGLLMGVFALLGFWIIRREARDEAREAAGEEVRHIAQMYGLEKNGARTHTNFQQNMPNSSPAADSGVPSVTTNPSEVSTAGAQREQPGGDE